MKITKNKHGEEVYTFDKNQLTKALNYFGGVDLKSNFNSLRLKSNGKKLDSYTATKGEFYDRMCTFAIGQLNSRKGSSKDIFEEMKKPFKANRGNLNTEYKNLFLDILNQAPNQYENRSGRATAQSPLTELLTIGLGSKVSNRSRVDLTTTVAEIIENKPQLTQDLNDTYTIIRLSMIKHLNKTPPPPEKKNLYHQAINIVSEAINIVAEKNGVQLTSKVNKTTIEGSTNEEINKHNKGRSRQERMDKFRGRINTEKNPDTRGFQQENIEQQQDKGKGGFFKK